MQNNNWIHDENRNMWQRNFNKYSGLTPFRNIRENSESGRLIEDGFHDLVPGSRYYIVADGVFTEHNLSLKPPSNQGTFVRYSEDGVAVFNNTKWMSMDPAYEAEYLNNDQMGNRWRFFRIDPSYITRQKMNRGKKWLSYPRKNIEYTPGTGGLSIKEELAQKLYDPERMTRFASTYPSNNIFTGGRKNSKSRKGNRKNRKSRKGNRK